MRYSLVICTRDRAASLDRSLGSVGPAVRQSSVDGGIAGNDTARTDVEVIVVDNGSTDGTGATARSHVDSIGVPLVLIEQREPGLSRARNAGVAAATGEWIVFTDDDCLLESDHFDVLDEFTTALPVDFIGGRIIAHDQRSDGVALLLDPEFRFFVPGRPILAGEVQGANLSIRRELLERIGGFDERLGAGTAFRCEDIEFVSRALDAGARGAHVPQLAIRHDHRRSGTDVREIEAANDVARGAYFAMRILDGDRAYVGAWVRSLRSRLGRHPRHLVRAIRVGSREISGAVGWVRRDPVS